MKTNNMIGIIEMSGRQVKSKKLKRSDFKCKDCGKKAKYQITEMNGYIWYYCGLCEEE